MKGKHLIHFGGEFVVAWCFVKIQMHFFFETVENNVGISSNAHSAECSTAF